jgi:hypothetical protein
MEMSPMADATHLIKSFTLIFFQINLPSSFSFIFRSNISNTVGGINQTCKSEPVAYLLFSFSLFD